MKTRFVLSAVLIGACMSRSPAAVAPSGEPAVSADLTRLREATRPFQNLDAAVAAGYARDVPACLIHEHHGAMGYHHTNPKNLDTKLDVTRPQILLYERLPTGAYRLNGVEFIVPYRLWARDSVAPVMMGQRMKHEDNLNFWYLHVWAWTQNSDGVFADFNPAVSCAPGAAKVFTPFSRPGDAEDK